MSNIDIQRLAVQPTAVVEVELSPFPEPPPELLRLPGMKTWFESLKLMRQRDKETLQRLLLTKTRQT